MANTKISALTELATTPDNADELAIVDGGSGGTTKRITVSNLMGAVPATSVEGTAILSTGESGGTKFLREDGDNSWSWQTVPATTVSAGALSDFNFDSNPIFGFSASVATPTLSSDAYTLLASDEGKVLLFNNASDVTLNLPVLTAGFTCTVIQIGAGEVVFTASSTTINNRQGHTKTADQHAIASLIYTDTNVIYTAGDTA